MLWSGIFSYLSLAILVVCRVKGAWGIKKRLHMQPLFWKGVSVKVEKIK